MSQGKRQVAKGYIERLFIVEVKLFPFAVLHVQRQRGTERIVHVKVRTRLVPPLTRLLRLSLGTSKAGRTAQGGLAR